jgi:predicted nucleic-acid-binding protein
MKGIDTNVLIRYLVSDDRRQAEQAGKAIQTAADEGESLMLCDIVLLEAVWVLEDVYQLPKTGIATLLDKVFSTAQFAIEDRDIARQALEDFRTTKADFADCLIGRKNRLLGCDKTMTFDKDLQKLDTFELL